MFPDDFERIEGAYDIGKEVYLFSDTHYIHYTKPAEQIIRANNIKYDIIRLSSMTSSRISQQLFREGMDGLLRLSTQETDELPEFTVEGKNSDAVIQVDTLRVDTEAFPLPAHSHLEFSGANGLYYWELFFHLPCLIAQSLNTAQKFEQAKIWYEYIFDPTEIDAYWKFLPFLTVDIEALIAALEEKAGGINIASLTEVLSSYTSAFMGRGELAVNAFDKLSIPVKSIQDQIEFSGDSEKLLEILDIIKRLPARYQLMQTNQAQIKAYLDDPFDPHAVAALRNVAYRRAVVMAYIDNLLDWADMLFTKYTVEDINEARMLYILAYDLLGERPADLGPLLLSDDKAYDDTPEGGDPKGNKGIGGLGAEHGDRHNEVYDFLFDATADDTDVQSLTHAAQTHVSVAKPYFYIPENAEILKYWDRVQDRLYKIRHCLNIMGVSQPLPLFQPPIDPMALVRAAAGGGGIAGAMAGLSVPVPHYRCTFMLAKARELVGKLSQLGNDLLGALEKKDAEELSLLQNRQEASILEFTRRIKEAQLRESETNLDNLKESQENAIKQQEHYNGLIEEGLIAPEHAQIVMMSISLGFNVAATILKYMAAVGAGLPQVMAGPFSFGVNMGGEQIKNVLDSTSDALQTTGEVINMGGEIAGIYAQHQRSIQDWELQKMMAESEERQLAHQIKGAEYQIEAARLELQSTEKEISNNKAMNTFMKEKFSSEQLYQWMAGRLSGLFFQTYKLALDMARAAERAFIFERGLKESEVSYIGGAYWDSLHKGLLAGDALDHDLDRLEKAYLENNSRGFEISKTISLAKLDPMAFVQLKTKRVCEFHFSEAFFDYDFQGHYNRQIKTVEVKLNAGKGKTVNATLTQLKNKTVLDPDPKAVKYLLKPTGEQPTSIRTDWRPGQQIVLSHVGDYDDSNGMFETNLNDDRYLPFEGTGAVSSWRLELNGARGSYTVEELTDAEIILKYTARQGGEAFASAVRGMLRPYPTAAYLKISEIFENEWLLYTHGRTDEMRITMTLDLLPNISGSKVTELFPIYTYQDEKGSEYMMLNTSTALKNGIPAKTPLSVSKSGTEWVFIAKGNRKNLKEMGLVVSYKAKV
jgi:hypothetical protein